MTIKKINGYFRCQCQSKCIISERYGNNRVKKSYVFWLFWRCKDTTVFCFCKIFCVKKYKKIMIFFIICILRIKCIMIFVCIICIIRIKCKKVWLRQGFRKVAARSGYGFRKEKFYSFSFKKSRKIFWWLKKM